MKSRLRARAWCAAGCLWLAVGTAHAARYTISDLLRLEAYGEALARPASHDIILEKMGHYDSAPAYPFGWFSRRLTSHLYRIDAAHPRAPELLFRQSRNAGYWSAGFSPDGRNLAVVRLEPTSCRLGIFNMTRRSMRWLPVSLDLPAGNPNPVWIDNHRLLVVATRPGTLPSILGYSREAIRELPTLWNRALQGQRPSATAIGAGRWVSVRQPRPNSRLVLIDLETGSEHNLLTGIIDDIAISGDHRRVAILLSGDDIQPDPGQTITPVTPSHHHRLVLVDIKGGTWHDPCPGCEIAPDLLAWSPQGSHLLIAIHRQDRTILYRIDDDQAAYPLDLGPWQPSEPIIAGSEQSPRAAWMGNHPIVLVHAADGARSQWLVIADQSGPSVLLHQAGRLLGASASGAFFANDSLIHVDARTGTSVTEGAVGSTGFSHWDPFRPGTRAAVNGFISAVTLDQNGVAMDAHPLSNLALGPGVTLPNYRARLLAIGDQGQWALSAVTDDHGAERLMLSLPSERQLVLETINQSLDFIRPPKPLLLASRQGDILLHHWLFLPSGVTARCPLIVVPYPGDIFTADKPPSIDPGAMSPIANVSLLTAHGYAVLMPSIPMASGNAPSLQRIAAATSAAVDAAIASGRIEASHMAIWGHSFGGYAALATALFDHRFRAIIASSAPSDLLSGYGSLDPRDRVSLHDGLNLPFTYGWSEGGQAAIGRPAWLASHDYEAASPYFHLDRITTPVLFIQGDVDQVGLDQSERMLTGLYRMRRDALLIRYWGEGHIPVSPANIKDIYDRVFMFLDSAFDPPQTQAAQAGLADLAAGRFRDIQPGAIGSLVTDLGTEAGRRHDK